MDSVGVSQYEANSLPIPKSKIDELVLRKLKALGIAPAHLCTDEVFVRRVFLDVIGTLPTADETRSFLKDAQPNKRSALIDRLLGRDEFADYWAMKWSDLLRVKSEFPINLWPLAAQGYHRWIYQAVRDNWPYDRFVREILTSSGSNFRVAPVNFFRAVPNKQPESIAKMVALTFMGVRAEKWPKARWRNMAVFFSQIGYKSTGEWKEEVVFFDPPQKTAAGETTQSFYPDGKPAMIGSDTDPRFVFTNWLLAPGNPWFTRNIANRVWSWLLGRGIIHEPDDIRPDNPPENPELLAYLEKEMVVGKYDLKHLFRLILNSQVYQLSSIYRSTKEGAANHFASYPLRRLEAEVLIDAIDQITGATETYSSATPEPFTFIPEDQRSIALADGSITSAFLDLFGRPARDTGLESERNNKSTPAQRLHLLNSSHIRKKIEQGPKMNALLSSRKKPLDIAEDLYLTILSRPPAKDELAVINEYITKASSKRDALIDIAWAAMNSSEFLYRH
jgi:hypothetical protein